jgi:UPF0755 protein
MIGQRWRMAVAGLAIVALGALAAAGTWALSANRAPSAETTSVLLDVERGTTVRALGRQLADRGVIRSALLFELRLRARGDADRIQAGTYDLPRNEPLDEIIDMLIEGRTLLVTVTVPEGLRLEETAGAVARGLGIDSAAFAAIAIDSLLADSLGLPTATLEGYLFPETYHVDPTTGPRELALHLVSQFNQVFTPAWRARADSLGRSVHEIVTLASIVEEEAQVASERTVIAGVFWNRLNRGMKLEADPTVQYSLGGHRPRVLYRDLEVDSPYNTYRNVGLPPGPISSPGAAALEATLYPDSVPYLYFFATGVDGQHTFSETFAEHNRKRRQLGR